MDRFISCKHKQHECSSLYPWTRHGKFLDANWLYCLATQKYHVSLIVNLIVQINHQLRVKYMYDNQL